MDIHRKRQKHQGIQKINVKFMGQSSEINADVSGREAQERKLDHRIRKNKDTQKYKLKLVYVLEREILLLHGRSNTKARKIPA